MEKEINRKEMDMKELNAQDRQYLAKEDDEQEEEVVLENRKARMICLWLATVLVVVLGLFHALCLWLLPLPSWWSVWYLLLFPIWWQSHKQFQRLVYDEEDLSDFLVLCLSAFIVFTSITLCLLPLYALLWFFSLDKVNKAIKEFLSVINE